MDSEKRFFLTDYAIFRLFRLSPLCHIHTGKGHPKGGWSGCPFCVFHLCSATAELLQRRLGALPKGNPFQGGGRREGGADLAVERKASRALWVWIGFRGGGETGCPGMMKGRSDLGRDPTRTGSDRDLQPVAVRGIPALRIPAIFSALRRLGREQGPSLPHH